MNIKRVCKNCKKEFYYNFFPCRSKRKNEGSFCGRKCHSLYQIGKPMSDSFKMKISALHKGSKRSEATKRKMSLAINLAYKEGRMPDLRGKKNPFWRGGHKWYNPIRSSAQYKRWRKLVLSTKGRRCEWCNSSDRIEIDHIKPFLLFPDLRFELSNGRVLCRNCHKTTETYGTRVKTIIKK